MAVRGKYSVRLKMTSDNKKVLGKNSDFGYTVAYNEEKDLNKEDNNY
jgi:hypothetical protein